MDLLNWLLRHVLHCAQRYRLLRLLAGLLSGLPNWSWAVERSRSRQFKQKSSYKSSQSMQLERLLSVEDQQLSYRRLDSSKRRSAMCSTSQKWKRAQKACGGWLSLPSRCCSGTFGSVELQLWWKLLRRVAQGRLYTSLSNKLAWTMVRVADLDCRMR